ncbi:uncharacterized protein Z518_00123 [Rhinocladiella mackenziei CBS 650.93]|uniref:Cyclase n=1 Tax=Rhinocladiella mackenziei CBS 650.93 TaxID=1442369 RepID=A0A0D2JI67_9EURO|nr:uncharacterized protein Z518_00123 [Rhinocladiella mackenziei CBS 650.93]KIX09045.1 hypothetical protein Z518_00123 [Rhinocladiella mackenziei CBS 650.93]
MAENPAKATAIPDFDSLPAVGDMPQGCAWGVFDKGEQKDHLGCINILTPEVVQQACKEARDGVSISLNWSMAAARNLLPPRKGLVHTVHDYHGEPFNFGFHSFDDEVEFNTQASSQWDSLVHFAHQDTGLCYNGVMPTRESLTQNGRDVDSDRIFPTLNHWHHRGALVGRGVLLDYRAWAREKSISYDCFDSQTISISDLEAIAKHQGTELRFGDILIIRSGYTEDLEALDVADQERVMRSGRAIGVEGNVQTAKWFWNHHFAAVAGDMLAFEVLPPLLNHENKREGGTRDLVLHQYFLSLFGLNIGELWDLCALGEHCKRAKRYEFLLTSVPLNVPGLVGSPPNAVAVF